MQMFAKWYIVIVNNNENLSTINYFLILLIHPLEKYIIDKIYVS